VITEIETLGCQGLSPASERVLREFFGSVTVVPLDDDIKEETIRLRRATKLRVPDAIIVATCLLNDADLLTCDADLLKVPGLKVSAPALKA
jgi:predicted nucleic acid-binding protein